MIRITATPFVVNKSVPLRISRGTSAVSENILVELSAPGNGKNREEPIVGVGEIVPFSIGGVKLGTKELVEQVSKAEAILQNLGSEFSPLDVVVSVEALRSAGLSSSVLAAIDTALHDWFGKYVGMPLWQMWGLSLSRIPQTTFTIGIGTPEEGIERVEKWREIGEPALFKVKLGNPEGIAHDKALISAMRDNFPEIPLMVDANCGWKVSEAIEMCEWLGEQHVMYVEQPLPANLDNALAEVRRRSPIPIFVDESCHTALDIVRLAPSVDGINIKLMKCGGLLEARNMIATARAHELAVMLGCYSDTVLANSAMAQLSPLVDYVDLDSHLNLVDDPFSGAVLEHGRIVPTAGHGIGVVKNGA